MNNDDQDRMQTIASLYELALLLEKHPELPIPFELQGGSYGHLSINFLDGDAKSDMLAAARAIPGMLNKRVWGGKTASYFTLDGRVGSISIQLTAFRESVCERVVTGTREVKKTVPDPMVVVPVVEVTETVEDVEWVCGPLLREQVAEVPVCAWCSLPAGHTGDHAPLGQVEPTAPGVL